MKRLVQYLLLIILLVILVLIYVQYEVLSTLFKPKLILHLDKTDISCHYVNDSDGLPAAEDVQFKRDAIFFHETSCKGGLNSRQACSIESAVKANPNRSVHVLFSGSIPRKVLDKGYFKLLRTLNVTFFRVHLPQYAEGTGMEQVLMKKILNPSAASWRIEHAADILRFITLYRHGGIYLDTDMLIVKNLDDLGRNFAGREIDDMINNAVMAFDKDGVGHQILEIILKDLADNYRAHYWNYNGPGALTRALEKTCHNGTKVKDFSAKTCKGFNVLTPEVFFPIPYPAFEQYFQPGDLNKYGHTYGFHFWNRLSHRLPAIEQGSLLYQLAEAYCPHVLEYYQHSFGFI